MLTLSVNDLLDYTDWERRQWYSWLRKHGVQVLEINAGPHGDMESDLPREFKILNFVARVTPKTIVIHFLMHEIRHWAQIATLCRLNGLAVEFRDLLFSPVVGGEFSRKSQE